jgi:hypothetical protein
MNSLVLVNETFSIVRFTDVRFAEYARIRFVECFGLAIAFFNHDKIWLSFHVFSMCVVLSW